jgi:3-oxoacyl-[acyl-carrier protein] reductase
VGSKFVQQLVAITPLGRIGPPSDITKVAVFLASDDSGWLTGEVILARNGSRAVNHRFRSLAFPTAHCRL